MAILTNSEEETEEVGARLARLVSGGSVVALSGELGTGKSVLCRGIARGLDIKEPVTSPTFTILKEYLSSRGVWLYHFDLYRIEHIEEVVEVGLSDVVFATNAVCVIEWAERIRSFFEKGDESNVSDKEGSQLIFISMEHGGGPNGRSLYISDDWEQMLQRELAQIQKIEGGRDDEKNEQH